MKFIKVYSKDHVILDEIYDFSKLKYAWTLNGLGKCEFDVTLEANTTNNVNYEFRNHIEVCEDNRIIWSGIIVDRGFQGSKLHINCYGYLALLSNRRLRSKTYAQMTYGNLSSTLINDVNAIFQSGVTIGTIQGGSLLTQRKVEDKDYLLEKLQNYIADCNNDIDVDNGRKFNFYLRKGTDKPHYSLEYGGDADNILKEPSLSQSILEATNNVYGESETDGNKLVGSASNNDSISRYGLIEGSYSANSGIVIQSTLDNYVQGELQRRAYPINNISLRIKDSTLCPYEDIAVGDSVIVSIISYWGFKELLRILEITHDEETGERDIILGQSIYRPQPPQVKLYRK